MRKWRFGLLLLALLPALGRADTVVLKDGQVLKGDVKGFDAYFLDVKNGLGTPFHIPWGEVRSVSHTTTANSWLEDTYITQQPAEVTVVVQPVSPGACLKAALFPGVLLHGWGLRQAHDENGFYSLAGAEVFGVIVGGFGLTELTGPSIQGENKDTSLGLTIGGGSIFALSWLWDLAFAAHTAEKFNHDHGLAWVPPAPSLAWRAAPSGRGGMLAFNWKY